MGVPICIDSVETEAGQFVFARRTQGRDWTRRLSGLSRMGLASKKFGSLSLSVAEARTGHPVPDSRMVAGCARRHMRLAARCTCSYARLGRDVLVRPGQKGKKASSYTTTGPINQCCRRTVKQYDVASIIDGNPSSRVSRLLPAPRAAPLAPGPASAFQHASGLDPPRNSWTLATCKFHIQSGPIFLSTTILLIYVTSCEEAEVNLLGRNRSCSRCLSPLFRGHRF